MSIIKRASFAVLPLLLLGGCGGNSANPASAIKPAQLTATSAMGEVACADPNDEAELLIVDLPGSNRGDMEVIMSEGLVAVAYDCNGLKLLKGCQIEGSYAYKGTLLKEELIRLENSDEIRANLPLSGAGVAAKMEGELQRGATLDLAVAMVGQQRAARYEVARDELKGRCNGATHFVQSAHVGAFSMKRGELAKAAAAADVFGFGASGASSSDSSTQNADGNLEACRKTKAEAKKPNSGCGALLRLYLLPISPSGSKLKAADADVVRVAGCPKGMTRIGGKCSKAIGPACNASTPDACKSPCDSGDGTACAVYAYALRYGKGLPKSREAAAMGFTRGCELGNAESCYYLGKQYRKGKGVTANQTRSVELHARGCALGDGRSCFYAGIAYMDGDGVPKDESRGFSMYEQGCAAGDPSSCTNLGKAYSVGKGVESDIFHSFKLYLRACEGGSAQACFNVGVRYGKGKGTTQDPQKRVQYYVRACNLDHAKGCYLAGEALEDASLLKHACSLGYDRACNSSSSSMP